MALPVHPLLRNRSDANHVANPHARHALPCPALLQDNHKRFSLFCKAAIEAARALPFGPGEDCVFVANDWHSALVPLLLKVREPHVLQGLQQGMRSGFFPKRIHVNC